MNIEWISKFYKLHQPKRNRASGKTNKAWIVQWLNYTALKDKYPYFEKFVANRSKHRPEPHMYKTMLTIEQVSDNSGNGWADDVTPINIHERFLFTSRVSFI